MKRTLLTLAFASMCLALFSQAPEKFNYQAVARNLSGAALPNQTISIEAKVLNSAMVPIYTERFIGISTNNIGLFKLEIGGGTVISGTFSTIDWSASPVYLEIGLDETGGTTFTTTATSQFLSVPYALYSKNTANDADNQNLSIAGNQLSISGGNTVTVPSGPGAGNGISAFIPQRTIFPLQRGISCMTSNLSGNEIFLASGVNGNIDVQKYTADSLTGMFYMTGIDGGGNGSTAQSMAVMGNNLFVYYGGGSPVILRWDITNLAGGSTSMTLIGAAIGGNPRELYSDGNFLFMYNAANAFVKFSLSGNQLINQGSVVFNNLGNNFNSPICDGSKVYFLKNQAIERYDVSGGNLEVSMPFVDNSLAIPQASDIGLAFIDNLRMIVGVKFSPDGTGGNELLMLNPIRRP